MLKRNIDEPPLKRLKRAVPDEIYRMFKDSHITSEVAIKVEDDWRAFKADKQAIAHMFPTVTPKHLRHRVIHKAIRHLHKRNKNQ